MIARALLLFIILSSMNSQPLTFIDSFYFFHSFTLASLPTLLGITESRKPTSSPRVASPHVIAACQISRQGHLAYQAKNLPPLGSPRIKSRASGGKELGNNKEYQGKRGKGAKKQSSYQLI